MPLTYSDYLKLDELLGLQQPLSSGPEHDEMLFIIIHQVYELWFKQMLHEVVYLKTLLVDNDIPRALHTLKRVLTILKIAVAQLDILETMTPLEFLSFRALLDTASGFQSFQFRELEFVLGYKRWPALEYYPHGSEGRGRLEARFNEPTLWDAFLGCLGDNGYQLPPQASQRDVRDAVQEDPEVQAMLINVYRSDATLMPLCERMVDLDEGIQEWRYRHVKMVERTIGTKQGTGGSAGVTYLAGTLFKPLFPDLWAIRAKL